jgi:hypothetical protein
MEWVRDRPLWLVAGLILIVVVGGFSALTSHIAGPEQMELMRETRFGRMMPEEDWQAQYEKSLNPSTMDRLGSGLGGGATTWVITFIYGLIYLLFGKLAGGTGSFKQVMGVTFWGGVIPYGLGYLVRLPLVFAKQSLVEVSPSLAILAPGADVISFKFQALTFFTDFFVWWGLVIVIIGFQKIHGFGRGQSATVAILSWLLVTGAMFGLNRLFIG